MPTASLLLFNKPYRVLSQFTDQDSTAPTAQKRQTLADYIKIKDHYPAGRLDYDSEGLLLLTNNGQLQSRISHPQHKLAKSYWVQIEGCATASELEQLSQGVQLNDGMTRPARVQALAEAPGIWPRNPALPRHRDQHSQWINIAITEGKNRQLRRMFAAVGHPVLRLIRHSIGPWSIRTLLPGEYLYTQIHLPLTHDKPKRRSR